ncbi:MAG: alpha/beta fold hydrolase [Caulobacter sp.]|jgi:pimeloyl-ACP methyl ester carboxylesterase|nr:alpha/beta fold hydrolase [Caulobacter sp.]
MTATANDTEAPIKRPSRLLALTEVHRAAFEMSTLLVAAPFLKRAPKGDGHPVLVMPGFIAGDFSTKLLRRYLTELGYEAHAWELGSNLGPHSIGRDGERLMDRLETIYAESGRKVSLIGWSLGGVMARELAKRMPDKVRQVITLGSPFTGEPTASNVVKIYQYITGEKMSDGKMQARIAASREPPPVPSTAIFSKGDGVVSWRNCIERPSPTTDNIEVLGSHCGLGVNPAVLFAVADRLAQAEGAWKPFERGAGWRAAVYPFSGHLQ